MPDQYAFDFLRGNGPAVELIRQIDWSATSLGSPQAWPQALKNIVNFILNSPLPKCVVWGDDFIEIYNDAYSQVIGFENLAASIGKSASFNLSFSWDRLKSGYHRCMQGETVISRDFKITNPGTATTEKYFDFYKSPIWLHDGTVGGILRTAVETTEKVKATIELSKSRESLLLIMRSAPVAMAVFNGPDFVIDLANDKALELWDKSAEEVINKPLFEALPEIKHQGLEQVLEKVFNDGIPLVLKEQLIHLHRDQKPESFYLDLSYEPLIGIDGTVHSIISTGVDVTGSVRSRRRLEEAEERTRVALQAADIGPFDLMIDPHQIITSDRFDEIFGIPKSTEHDDYFNVIHPDDLGDRSKTMQEALSTGKLFQQYRVIKNNGDTPWVQIQGTVYFDQVGKPVRILGTAIDITEQKRLQQVKDDFISIASHELRTPLTSLNASLQLLARKIITNDKLVNSMLSQASTSIKRLTKLSSDLLDVSRFRTGKTSLNKSEVIIGDLIESGVQNLLSDSQQQLVISGDRYITIKIDPIKIERVIANLVGNAIKYAPESKRIVIHLENLNDHLKVSVVDQGPGIPEKILPSLFDRYFQAESSPVNFSGLGLGLFIAAEIIKLHNGTIGVKSELGKGSTFWFTLPYHKQ